MRLAAAATANCSAATARPCETLRPHRKEQNFESRAAGLAHSGLRHCPSSVVLLGTGAVTADALSSDAERGMSASSCGSLACGAAVAAGTSVAAAAAESVVADGCSTTVAAVSTSGAGVHHADRGRLGNAVATPAKRSAAVADDDASACASTPGSLATLRASAACSAAKAACSTSWGLPVAAPAPSSKPLAASAAAAASCGCTDAMRFSVHVDKKRLRTSVHGGAGAAIAALAASPRASRPSPRRCKDSSVYSAFHAFHCRPGRMGSSVRDATAAATAAFASLAAVFASGALPGLP